MIDEPWQYNNANTVLFLVFEFVREFMRQLKLSFARLILVRFSSVFSTIGHLENRMLLPGRQSAKE